MASSSVSLQTEKLLLFWVAAETGVFPQLAQMTGDNCTDLVQPREKTFRELRGWILGLVQDATPLGGEYEYAPEGNGVRLLDSKEGPEIRVPGDGLLGFALRSNDNF